MNYKHTQIGYLIIIVFSITLLFLLFTILQTGWNSLLFGVLAVLILAGTLFSSLTVAVTEDLVRLYFTFGLLRITFPLKEIETAKIVRNPWYYGWGMHFTLQGWVFNVSGSAAVELKMMNGKRYRIGSDDAAGLAEAILLTLRQNSSIHPSLD